ncbi:MAG: histidine phosphatase family protein [Gammaproteobacteria bacterium]|nr:histidine phosphatase family protein [Gammaproteobacteria bacterium]
MTQQQSTILLVRHGQTEWNQQHRIQGHQDSPLTSLGKQQAQQTKILLEQFDIQQAFVSPLKRAVDTTEIILQGRSLRATILNDLSEINLGPWEGKTRAETALTHPEEYNSFWHRPDTFALSGAETFQQLQQRIVNSLDTIFANAGNNNVLVVSHWIAIKVALAFYSGIPLSQLSSLQDPKNGSLLMLTKQLDQVCIEEKSPTEKL